jgi:hypothetical protein
MMEISDFQKYIDLHGADLSRWPRHEIRPAIDLIQRDPAAGKIFSGAEKLDQMLRHYPPVAVNMNALASKIIRRAKQGAAGGGNNDRRAKPAVLNPAYFYVPGGGLLVAAILGFMIGFHAMPKESLLLDQVFYMQDQAINSSEEAS